jgi:hypothetical protein
MTPVTLSIFLLGLVVILLASAFVAAPLFQGVEAGVVPVDDQEAARWERQKRQALAAIKEIELDHQLGKLSEEDLASMRARFEGQALEAMAALERRSGKGARR